MIQVSHLTKYYGDFLAVNDLSFDIQDGHVYGFLGPNGAGKSTTMNIMTGCLSPTDGTVRIGGFDILEQPEQAKRLIGYLPEQPPLYPNETPQEYLTFVGEAKGLRGKELREEIDSAVESAGIESVRDRLIGTLSKGYRQRVGIAQALLGKPQVIILDMIRCAIRRSLPRASARSRPWTLRSKARATRLLTPRQRIRMTNMAPVSGRIRMRCLTAMT